MASPEQVRTIATLSYDDRFVRTLPGDRVHAGAPRQVLHAAYSEVAPTAMPDPRLLAFSSDVAALLELDPVTLAGADLARMCGGLQLAEGMRPYAACYGGHQFGNWAGQLGDGRAITLGEVLTTYAGRQELQLKGAGRTPYSRGADGRAVLRSSLREYLCSEAMHALGVPTTRALCLVATGESVWRDILYDGHPRQEPGAVVCRVAPSFVRFGNFELPAARGDHDLLKAIADYVITTHFPALTARGPDAVAALFDEVCGRTAQLFAEIMRVGFVHGVLNTDNMSILGLCIDYGPFGFVDRYDPNFTPNTTDRATRRYRYGQQPLVAQWNLARLGSALLPLVGDAAPLERSLARYGAELARAQQAVWTRKLGLPTFRDEGEGAGDGLLVNELEHTLEHARADMPRFFRTLAKLDLTRFSTAALDDGARAQLHDVLYDPDEASTELLARWVDRYAARVRDEQAAVGFRRATMDAANPKYVLRNYLAQQAIDKAEEGDMSLAEELFTVLAAPYAEQPGKERFAEKRPPWAEHRPGCGMLSCSS